jgi:circadian clock protein KaiB
MTPRIESNKQDGEVDSIRKVYDLYLYIAGSFPRSLQAVANVRKLCENSLSGICDLKVVDILQQPQVAKDDQIIAVPTLIKKLPKPVRILIGDMSNTDDILRALEG